MNSERDNGGVIELADVKAGDFVALIVKFGWHSWRTTKAPVTRTTPARIMLHDRVFNRSGRQVGNGGYDRPRIEAWCEEVHAAQIADERAEHRLTQMRSKLSDYAWRDISQECADAVFAALGLTGKDSA